MWSEYLFAYGTVRPGGINYHQLEPMVEEIVGLGCTEGILYFLPGHDEFSPGFPAARLGAQGNIMGTLFKLNANEYQFQGFNDMELGAGFEPTLVDVIVYKNTLYKNVLAYNYTRAVGKRIQSGDWATVVNNIQTGVIGLSY